MVGLSGKTLLISGASRGIGRAIALRAARDGANVAVLGKTDAPNPKLAGTVHETVAAIEAVGGRGIACVCDVRFEDQVLSAVENTISAFGGIDILVNNASAISLTSTLATE
ncbi:MAG TPA: SDR family NAD(P)-dependent oxidoreductase, partial [Polyangiaceae bacterium]